MNSTFLFQILFLFLSFIVLILLCFKKTISLKLWVVNLIIFDCLPFFVPRSGWALSTCLKNSPLSIPASLAIVEITLLLSSSVVSSFPGFQNRLHDLREYWLVSSSC